MKIKELCINKFKELSIYFHNEDNIKDYNIGHLEFVQTVCLNPIQLYHPGLMSQFYRHKIEPILHNKEYEFFNFDNINFKTDTLNLADKILSNVLKETSDFHFNNDKCFLNDVHNYIVENKINLSNIKKIYLGTNLYNCDIKEVFCFCNLFKNIKLIDLSYNNILGSPEIDKLLLKLIEKEITLIIYGNSIASYSRKDFFIDQYKNDVFWKYCIWIFPHHLRIGNWEAVISDKNLIDIIKNTHENYFNL